MYISTPEQRLDLNITPEEYTKIRNTWLRHVTLEEEGKFDQLIAETMTEDCVYEIVETGERWDGHVGAREFYRQLSEAVPDQTFELRDIVVGPQGVFGVAMMRGTQKKPFAGINQVNQKIHWRLINLFPWDPEKQLIAGERLYYFRPIQGVPAKSG